MSHAPDPPPRRSTPRRSTDPGSPGPCSGRPGRPDPGRPRHLRGQHRPPDHRTLPATSTAATCQWLVTAYVMMSGGGLLLGGRIADLLSRRGVFLTGLDALHRRLPGQRVRRQRQRSSIAARAVQGLSAALLTPSALSLITTTYAGVAAQGRTRPVGSGRQPRRRRRRPRRRSHHHLDQLAVHLLDQRPHRSRRPGGGAPHHRQTERDPPQRRRLRHPRRRHRHRRSRHDGLRPRRHRDPRLVVGPDHDRAAGVRRPAGRSSSSSSSAPPSPCSPRTSGSSKPWSPGRRSCSASPGSWSGPSS